MLRIEIIGNLGSDPEQRYTAEGKAQVSIRVAVNSRRRGRDGADVERTDWFRVRAMGSKAEYVAALHEGTARAGDWPSRDQRVADAQWRATHLV